MDHFLQPVSFRSYDLLRVLSTSLPCSAVPGPKASAAWLKSAMQDESFQSALLFEAAWSPQLTTLREAEARRVSFAWQRSRNAGINIEYPRFDLNRQE